ncbi:aspartate carbamoyltransferase catalytic subunit [Brevibacillus laterosporus]|uniref:aspartate carbamoyltransferase catalytic subunit n=1 Tax=Brevibacillus laterosporus TaxID=1465 RepID=UPI000E6C236B|nr:aspartate carbamoyltransferase catalytic subunit [Brevibacillus laterosporus]AYB37137.1 aspartate carbamoyltransferase catalytic subunit [Brevibacillus laterosporus]MBM7109233.1 Aspartate carbamoyltransferase [Brevibacillus laterosporus]NKQ22149.1 aspartate carbamoyltransferase catalytic subunit [Brevibacillus laterosporus]WNX30061.1 aspartate carbamoyltransferase catalytic subunit [Brevibacillus laterosporus]
MKNLLGIKNLSKGDIEAILREAEYFAARPNENINLLQGRFIANLFFEASTRTRFSFEVAEKRLGAHVLNFSDSSSSTTKGETIYDTLRTLESMGVETAVIRTGQNGLFTELANEQNLNMHLVNAGEGTMEHPTQCLLDLLTMKQHHGGIQGLQVAIIGDLRHSRVFGSHLDALPKLGAKLMVSGPDQLLRDQTALPEGVRVVGMEEAIAKADVVMMLRVQLERHTGQLFSSKETYHQAYGLTLERAAMMKTNAIIMHPAPFNRGVEIDGQLVESKKSVIFPQVTNGVAVRMAVIAKMMTGGMSTWESSLKMANC